MIFRERLFLGCVTFSFVFCFQIICKCQAMVWSGVGELALTAVVESWKEGEQGQRGHKWPLSAPRGAEQRDVVFVSVCISGTDAIIYVFMTL